MGTVYAIEAVLPDMLRRGFGQIVGLVSLSGICPLPVQSAYSASKAAVAAYLQCLRSPLRRRGIQVISVIPAFVQTALLESVLTATGAKMPRWPVSAEAAAARILTGMRSGRRIISFPRRVVWPAHLLRFFPAAIGDLIMSRLCERQGLPY
jgi:short-subunit dehydrogenase